MTNLPSLMSQGLTFGLFAAALPGPLQGYLVNTVLMNGWRRGLLVIAAPLVVDIPIVIAVLLALEVLATYVPLFADFIRIIGGAFVLYLAWSAVQVYRSGVDVLDSASAGPEAVRTASGTFTRGLLMNLLSPGPYLFWTTVNGPLLRDALSTSVTHGVVFLLAFYGTFLGLWVLLAVALDRVRAVNPQFTRRLVLVTAILMLIFGLQFMIEGILGILG